MQGSRGEADNLTKKEIAVTHVLDWIPYIVLALPGWVGLLSSPAQPVAFMPRGGWM